MSDEKKSRASAAMSGESKKKHKGKKSSDSKKKKRKVHTIHISKLDSGGYLAKHDEMPEEGDPSMGPQPQHAIGDEDQLAQHFAEHMPSGADEEQPPAEQPPPAAAPPMPGVM